MTHRKNQSIHIITRFLILVVFSLSIASSTLVTAKPLETMESNLGLSTQKQSEEELSTPELIEQAFVNGEITAEQRILYLNYAIYDYESLPTQFRGNAPWEGTFYVQEINSMQNAIESGKTPPFSPAVQAELSRLAAQAGTVCDREDGTFSLESYNFHLSYSGIAGGLTAQDYLDALENISFIEVTTFGWPKPPYCESGIGTCINDNPWDKYPVLVADNLDPLALGYVVHPYSRNGCGSYCGKVGDNPNTAQIETESLSKNKLVNSDLVEWCSSIRETICVDVN